MKKLILTFLIVVLFSGCANTPKNATNYFRDLRGKNVEGTFTSNSLWGGTTFNFKAEELGSNTTADTITYRSEANENNN